MLTMNFIEKEILLDVLNNPGDTFYENVLSDFLDEQGIEHDFRKPLHNNCIEELKFYHEKCLGIWKNYWTNIGLCTKPTDENKAERYFYNLCKQLGLEKPKSIIWLNSPFDKFNLIADCSLSQVLNQVLNRAWSQVWHRTKGQVLSKVWQIREQTKVQVLNRALNRVHGQLTYSQHATYWISHYAYCMQVLRIELPKSLIPRMLLAQEVHWWLVTKAMVFAVRKPKELIVKDGNLVKLVYQDGYAII